MREWAPRRIWMAGQAQRRCALSRCHFLPHTRAFGTPTIPQHRHSQPCRATVGETSIPTSMQLQLQLQVRHSIEKLYICWLLAHPGYSPGGNLYRSHGQAHPFFRV